MGYTHYWRINVMQDQERYDAALDLVRTVVRQAPKDLLAGPLGDAGTKPVLDDGVEFNGLGEYSHETFYLFPKLTDLLDTTKNFVQQDDDGFVVTFCKTARKPYDYIVTACLAVLKDALKEDIRVSSDGVPGDWADGVAWANKCLGADRIKCPDLGSD